MFAKHLDLIEWKSSERQHDLDSERIFVHELELEEGECRKNDKVTCSPYDFRPTFLDSLISFRLHLTDDNKKKYYNI